MTLAVGGVVFDDRRRVCLIRRARPPMQGSWSLPGGRVEAGEPTIVALKRELREETGLEVEVGALIEVVEVGEYVIHDHLCQIVGGELRAGDDAAEVAMVAPEAINGFGVSKAVERVVRRALSSLGSPRS